MLMLLLLILLCLLGKHVVVGSRVRRHEGMMLIWIGVDVGSRVDGFLSCVVVSWNIFRSTDSVSVSISTTTCSCHVVCFVQHLL